MQARNHSSEYTYKWFEKKNAFLNCMMHISQIMIHGLIKCIRVILCSCRILKTRRFLNMEMLANSVGVVKVIVKLLCSVIVDVYFQSFSIFMTHSNWMCMCAACAKIYLFVKKKTSLKKYYYTLLYIIITNNCIIYCKIIV